MTPASTSASARTKPLIAILPRTEERSNNNGLAMFAQSNIVQAVMEAGGIPFVPAETDDPAVIDVYLDTCQGCVFQGGLDIDPELYGQERLDACGPARVERDNFERAFLLRAIERDIPLFGICRGNQLLNAALGGTLWQDLPSQYAGTASAHLLAHDQGFPFDACTHHTGIVRNTLLERILCEASLIDSATLHADGSVCADHDAEPYNLMVNTLHHQAVDQLAPGLMVNAYAPDGVVEGLELPGKRFVLTVQWHPEYLWQHDRRWLCIFRALVLEASRSV